jgi:hypothetical protein
MRANELIFHLIHEEGTTPTQLAEKLGVSGKHNVYQTIHCADMKVKNLLRYMDALGYDVVVRNRKSGKEYVVDDSEELSSFRYDFPLDLERRLK